MKSIQGIHIKLQINLQIEQLIIVFINHLKENHNIEKLNEEEIINIINTVQPDISFPEAKQMTKFMNETILKKEISTNIPAITNDSNSLIDFHTFRHLIEAKLRLWAVTQNIVNGIPLQPIIQTPEGMYSIHSYKYHQ